jgi:hypothetical protein
MTRPALLIALAATVLLATTGCGGSGSHARSSSAQGKLTDLHNISQLQTAFNNASDEPRLIVLVSPT